MPSRITIPGVGEVDLSAPEQPDPSAAVAQLCQQIFMLADLWLQYNLRLSVGWKPADAIQDMRLNVPPPPQKHPRVKDLPR
jgi:hypothetical protein